MIIGETCLGKIYRTYIVDVKKTYGNGRASILKPLDSEFILHENHFIEDRIGAQVFNMTKAVDKLGLSVENIEFFKLMDTEFKKGRSGNWVAPLPFRSPRSRLPNNSPLALKRARSLHANLQKSRQERTLCFFHEKDTRLSAC